MFLYCKLNVYIPVSFCTHVVPFHHLKWEKTTIVIVHSSVKVVLRHGAEKRFDRVILQYNLRIEKHSWKNTCKHHNNIFKITHASGQDWQRQSRENSSTRNITFQASTDWFENCKRIHLLISKHVIFDLPAKIMSWIIEVDWEELPTLAGFLIWTISIYFRIYIHI